MPPPSARRCRSGLNDRQDRGVLHLRFRKAGEFPALKDVQHSNFCDVGVMLNPRTNTVMVLSAIDNLVKGAAGQAVQNFNIRFGYAEGTGLL